MLPGQPEARPFGGAPGRKPCGGRLLPENGRRKSAERISASRQGGGILPRLDFKSKARTATVSCARPSESTNGTAVGLCLTYNLQQWIRLEKDRGGGSLASTEPPSEGFHDLPPIKKKRTLRSSKRFLHSFLSRVRILTFLTPAWRPQVTRLLPVIPRLATSAVSGMRPVRSVRNVPGPYHNVAQRGSAGNRYGCGLYLEPTQTEEKERSPGGGGTWNR